MQTVLELDKLDLTEPVSSCSKHVLFHFISFNLSTSLQFHKRQEKDLLDQKKEKEETLLLEMVSVTLHRYSVPTTSGLL